MEKRHFHPGIFILVLAVSLSFLSSLMTPSFLRKNGMTLSGSVCSVSLAHEKRNSIDVLVVGDSESYTSVSPMALWKQYGITSFDVGKAGAKISETKEMLEDALGTQSPQVVLLETNNLFRYKAKTEDEHASRMGISMSSRRSRGETPRLCSRRTAASSDASSALTIRRLTR